MPSTSTTSTTTGGYFPIGGNNWHTNYPIYPVGGYPGYNPGTLTTTTATTNIIVPENFSIRLVSGGPHLPLNNFNLSPTTAKSGVLTGTLCYSPDVFKTLMEHQIDQLLVSMPNSEIVILVERDPEVECLVGIKDNGGIRLCDFSMSYNNITIFDSDPSPLELLASTSGDSPDDEVSQLE